MQMTDGRRWWNRDSLWEKEIRDPHLWVNIQDAHPVRVNDVGNGLGLNAVQMVLVFAKFDELVRHNLRPHLVLCNEVETILVFNTLRCSGRV